MVFMDYAYVLTIGMFVLMALIVVEIRGGRPMYAELRAFEPEPAYRVEETGPTAAAGTLASFEKI